MCLVFGLEMQMSEQLNNKQIENRKRTKVVTP